MEKKVKRKKFMYKVYIGDKKVEKNVTKVEKEDIKWWIMMGDDGAK